MARKKLELTYIVNDTKRRATFKQRKRGLIKMVNDMSILCGIEACAIIYSPDESQPKVWPSPSEAQRVVSKFRELPEHEQNKKMTTQGSFLRERIQKVQEKLQKQRYENRKTEMSNLMVQCLNAGGVFNNCNLIDLNDLSWAIDQDLNKINQKISKISQCQQGTTSGAIAINEEQAPVRNTIN